MAENNKNHAPVAASLNLDDELENCEVCRGKGEYRQTYTAGCGFGSYQCMGKCDYCKGTGKKARRTPPAEVSADTLPAGEAK